MMLIFAELIKQKYWLKCQIMKSWEKKNDPSPKPVKFIICVLKSFSYEIAYILHPSPSSPPPPPPAHLRFL